MEVRTDIKSSIFISSSNNHVCLYACAYLQSSCILISQENGPFSPLTCVKHSHIYLAPSSFVQFVCHYVFIAIAQMSCSYSTRELKHKKDIWSLLHHNFHFDLTNKKQRDHPENMYKFYVFTLRKLHMSLQYKNIEDLCFLQLNI